MPMIVRSPGRVPGGRTSDHVCAFWDVMPTLSELASVKAPAAIDGISFAPTLLPSIRRAQPQHEYLYWEFFEGGFQQAIRLGNWKAVRVQSEPVIELYDLESDVEEQHDVAARHPEIVAKAADILKRARTESAHWSTSRGR